MKHGDHEIVGIVFCEKSVEPSREVIEIARMSGDAYPVDHIGSTTECDSSFCRYSSGEDSDMHVYYL